MPLQSEKLRLLRRIPDIRFEEEAKGYSKDQVDRVLANLAPLADEIERLQARLSEAENRAASAEARLVEARSPSASAAAPDMPPAPQPDFDETLRNTLVSAQRQADMTVREAREEAERLRTEAEFQSNALLADARDQSAEMTTEAVAYRERLMAEAAAERARMLEEATEEARNRVEQVENELVEAHEQERASLIDQITDLTEKHRLLQDDVDRFEQHLTGRRSEVQSALDEIISVLDDPGRLRPEGGIEPAELDEFEPDDYPPIAVEVVALNELESEAQLAAAATAPTSETISAADLDELDLTDESIVLDGEVDEERYVDNGHTADFVETASVDDPQLGVQTQVVPPPPILAEEESVVADVEVLTDDQTIEPAEIDDQTWPSTEDGPDEDAMSDFFNNNDDDRSDRGGGWFGRRR